MRNPLTIQVESGLGAVFVLLFTGFFVSILFVAIRNFNSDTLALRASETQVKSISSTERQLIVRWMQDNQIELPKGKGYRHVIQQYPTRPWLKY
ncbi:MAG: hypothetical protein A3C88_01925 [Candidatus Yanofskybacteria bacterium RIFCSPHIGHO2_02_FULL_50_12]|uniref:Uncharacterized protein n=1 Tax=Candidatus Yanofskybacteria bacterium RIFCSPHIGHO2_02_FULL_50_12 TaxID=1802685 RepID=A0A1F8FVF1_9BACT|nr:MAG: hypothetical protein A3C88_01925 [Candidatus Yanofskybacteria bacterium RIFCSPHIGHO2_02_FULL_50_12]